MMRRLIVIFGLTLAAAPLQAQAAKIELRAVLFGMPTKRNAALDPTTVGEASGTLKGGEIGLRAKTFGVAAEK